MDKEAEKFLEAEEMAVNLVESLKKLLTEATSYQTATEELETVRRRLLDLIESIERAASGSYEVIETFKKIGGPEILSRLANLEDKLTEKVDEQSREMVNKLVKIEDKLTEALDEQSKGINKLKTLIMVTLASSIIAVIVGIIVLLR